MACFGASANAADRDGDRIPDERDQCPDEGETYNGCEDEDGCPDRAVDGVFAGLGVDRTAFVFVPRRAVLARESRETAAGVAASLKYVPGTIEIVGYRDEHDPPKLALARANAAIAALVAAGVPRTRLRAAIGGKDDPALPTWASVRIVDRRFFGHGGHCYRSDRNADSYYEQLARSKPTLVGTVAYYDAVSPTEQRLAFVVRRGDEDVGRVIVLDRRNDHFAAWDEVIRKAQTDDSSIAVELAPKPNERMLFQWFVIDREEVGAIRSATPR